MQALVSVDLLANGDTLVDGQKADTDADVSMKLHPVSTSDPALRAVVRAEASVPHGRVIHLLDLLKQAGFERIAFGVAAVGNGAAPGPSTPAPTAGSPPGVLGGSNWQCLFPASADDDGIDRAAVLLFVAVDANGKARWVRLLQDPGYGFGRAAEDCAMKIRYAPARDKQGAAVPGTTPPIRVRFER